MWPPDVKSRLTGKAPDAERLKAGGEWEDRGRNGWMASLTQWTWAWTSSGRWWRTGKPGVLQSMGSQRVRHDWATELNWTEYIYYFGQVSLRRNGVTLTVNKSVQNAVPGCNLKNDWMILVYFQGKPFSITSLMCSNHWCWRNWSWTVLWRSSKPSRTNIPKKMSFSSYGIGMQK